MKFSFKRFALPAVVVSLLASTFSTARADVKDRLFDFTDAYYRKNGVDPTKISGRRQAIPPLATTDTPNFSYQRNVRALLTLPAYDHSGNPWFFTVLGGCSVAAFTPDAAGQRARQIADQSVEYIFPQRGTDPMGLGALRQSVIMDMRNGYFSNNPLGLWKHVWVNYTSKAFTTKDGQKTLKDLEEDNGLAVDGTPIITDLSDLDKLIKKGFVTAQEAPLNSDLRYAICPMIKDPRNGGIAPDQFLAITRKPDGTPLEPFFANLFNRLQAKPKSSSPSANNS